MDIFDEKDIAPWWYAVVATITLTALSVVGLSIWLLTKIT